MRRRIIVFSAILLLFVNLFCVTGTYAWFTSANEVGDGEFQSGLVLYEPGGEFQHVAYKVDPDTGSAIETNELVVPGTVLVGEEGGPLTLANKSNVKTKLKVEITYYFSLRPGAETSSEQYGTESSPSYPESMDKILNFTMGENWVPANPQTEPSNNDRTRVYYYGTSPDANDGKNQGAVIEPDTLKDPFHVITTMKLADDYAGFDLNEQLHITVKFFARQSDYLDDWSTIADYEIGI